MWRRALSLRPRRKKRFWEDDGSPVYGGDRWAIVECAGCHTVSFIHSHWFSEDEEFTENSWRPIVHSALYPPTPPRKMPEWGEDIEVSLPEDALWIVQLHNDIYAAMGLKAYTLAAMGTRAIVDFVVTSKAPEVRHFKDKLNLLKEQTLITETQSEVIYAAFDAGSAAAHRGYSPTREHVYTLLDITESLLHQIYIDPMQQRRQAEAATALKSNTPQRTDPKKRLGDWRCD